LHIQTCSCIIIHRQAPASRSQHGPGPAAGPEAATGATGPTGTTVLRGRAIRAGRARWPDPVGKAAVRGPRRGGPDGGDVALAGVTAVVPGWMRWQCLGGASGQVAVPQLS